MNPILDKTDKGREEIATRKYRLAPRLRTLLVLIDGKHDANDLLKKVSGLGLDEQSLTELLDSGFVHSTMINTLANPDSIAAELDKVSITEPAASYNSMPPATEPVSGEQPVPEAPSHAEQYQALYNFYTETIKSTVGLRGYGLQLKVERASSIDDFRNLRQAYLDAVLKAKGNEMARSLGDRLDQLLHSTQ